MSTYILGSQRKYYLLSSNRGDLNMNKKEQQKGGCMDQFRVVDHHPEKSDQMIRDVRRNLFDIYRRYYDLPVRKAG